MEPDQNEEPNDEDIWLAAIARQVEEHARPLFIAAWLWLGQRAIELDEDEPAS